MNPTPVIPAEAPIFEDLVEEHGDVLTESREAARATEAEAAEALDWSDLRAAAADEDD
ncbi:hypothetical protein N566_24040 [Streptomycetaceae bacterium MP113-05]|nr:hypothetical protein N566_24040 [Streptomycetaceae bacterium MP113-05]